MRSFDVLLLVGLLITFTQASRAERCKEGESKQLDCNSCGCTGGVWLCTEQVCPEPRCIHGDRRQYGCNSCDCVHGQWICTVDECDTGPNLICPRGSIFFDKCANLCICSESGVNVCTRKGCHEEEMT